MVSRTECTRRSVRTVAERERDERVTGPTTVLVTGPATERTTQRTTQLTTQLTTELAAEPVTTGGESPVDPNRLDPNRRSPSRLSPSRRFTRRSFTQRSGPGSTRPIRPLRVSLHCDAQDARGSRIRTPSYKKTDAQFKRHYTSLQ